MCEPRHQPCGPSWRVNKDSFTFSKWLWPGWVTILTWLKGLRKTIKESQDSWCSDWHSNKHLLNVILKCYPCNNLVCPKNTDCNTGTSNATYFSYGAQPLNLERSGAFFMLLLGFIWAYSKTSIKQTFVTKLMTK